MLKTILFYNCCFRNDVIRLVLDTLAVLCVSSKARQALLEPVELITGSTEVGVR